MVLLFSAKRRINLDTIFFHNGVNQKKIIKLKFLLLSAENKTRVDTRLWD
jgi:myo-inositol catabolism protein IolC